MCLLLAMLVGCGSSATTSGRLPVVASTNVYGDIVRQIGGSQVAVTSVLSDPNADPHLFEPGTANGLAVARARLVVENGLDYDAFMTRLERAAPSGDRRVLTVADVVGVHGRAANPHLWYDVRALPRIAAAIEQALVALDPAQQDAYEKGLGAFIKSLAPLQAVVRAIAAQHAGAPVAATEPVAGYLIRAAGLRDLARSSFTRPIEQGTEPAASAVSAMVALVAKRRIRVLLYNRQAVSPITARIRDAAGSAGVPVVAITETLPVGMTFQQWQLEQAHELQRALGQ